MITLVRSANTKVVGDADTWAKEIVEYVNSLDLPVSVQFMRERFGDRTKIYWIISGYEDHAALDSLQKKLASDEGYMERVKKTPPVFVEGSLHDLVLETVE